MTLVCPICREPAAAVTDRFCEVCGARLPPPSSDVADRVEIDLGRARGHQRPRPRAPPQRGRDGAGPPPRGRIGDDAGRGRLRRRLDRPTARARLAHRRRRRAGRAARRRRRRRGDPTRRGRRGRRRRGPARAGRAGRAVVHARRRAGRHRARPRSPSAGWATAAPTGSPRTATPACSPPTTRGPRRWWPRASSTRPPRCATRAPTPSPAGSAAAARRSPASTTLSPDARRASCCCAPTGCGTTSPTPLTWPRWPCRWSTRDGPRAAAHALTAHALDAGGRDNITVVCIPINSSGGSAP